MTEYQPKRYQTATITGRFMTNVIAEAGPPKWNKTGFALVEILRCLSSRIIATADRLLKYSVDHLREPRSRLLFD